MQKTFNIIVALVLIALAVLLFLMWRSINKKFDTLIALIPPPVPAPPPAAQRTSISGAEFWNEIKNSAEDMTLQMKFKP